MWVPWLRFIFSWTIFLKDFREYWGLLTGSTYDMPKNLDQVLLKVRKQSSKQGFRFTKKRENILILLLKAKIPLSAYDIAERYKNSYSEAIPAMSVYRILDSLIDANYAHKLKTTNQYIVCSHITDTHDHGITQFLICNTCHLISEIGAGNELISELKMSIENTGFSMLSEQLELHGMCLSCKGNTSRAQCPVLIP